MSLFVYKIFNCVLLLHILKLIRHFTVWAAALLKEVQLLLYLPTSIWRH